MSVAQRPFKFKSCSLARFKPQPTYLTPQALTSQATRQEGLVLAIQTRHNYWTKKT